MARQNSATDLLLTIWGKAVTALVHVCC